MNTLVILSSILGEASLSSNLARHAIAQIKAADPAGSVVVRDLSAAPLPHFDGATAGAFFTPAESRTVEQQAVVAVSDALIAELQQADRVILAVPVYNFGIPSQLKSYLDHLARAGVTFRYTAQGPEGLIKGKEVVLVVTRGGVALGTADDTVTPYLKTMLGFLGMDNVTVVAAEGVKMGDEALARALDGARSDLVRLLAA